MEFAPQLLNCHINAIFNKFKADHYRYIYECLSGDNGLLYDDDLQHDFDHKQQSLVKYWEHATNLQYEKAKRCIYLEKTDFAELVEEHHGTVGRAKYSHPIPGKTVDGSGNKQVNIDKNRTVPFHTVFFSSLMNQQVFCRDVLLQQERELLRFARDNNRNQNSMSDVQIERQSKEKN